MIKVGIAEYKTATNPDILSCIGLGSCVGICLYDPVSKIGGLAHVLLPDSAQVKKDRIKPGKFADTAVAAILSDMEEHGASKRNITAKLVGGARMFALPNSNSNGIFDVGRRNAEAVKNALASMRIRLAAEDTGGDYGRSIEFHVGTGKILVKSKGGVTEI